MLTSGAAAGAQAAHVAELPVDTGDVFELLEVGPGAGAAGGWGAVFGVAFFPKTAIALLLVLKYLHHAELAEGTLGISNTGVT